MLQIEILNAPMILLKLFILAELQTVCRSYYEKICKLEEDKYDLEVIEKHKAFEVYLIEGNKMAVIERERCDFLKDFRALLRNGIFILSIISKIGNFRISNIKIVDLY